MSLNQADLTALNNGNTGSAWPKDAGYKTGVAKCVFNPSAVAGDRTIDAHGLGLTLPKGCIVTRCIYKVLTTFTSATDAGTIAISVVAANDIISAAAISTGTTWDAAGPIVCVPVTATVATWLTTTADVEVTATVAVEALTAGKLVLWVEYLYFGDVD